MAALSDFFPSVTLDVSGCPAPVLEAAVRRAAITFCEDTLLLTAVHDNISSVPGVDEYVLTAPAEQEVHTVLYVRYGYTWLPPLSPLEVLRTSETPAAPAGYWFVRPATLHLFGAADDVRPIAAHMSLKPAASATTVPDILKIDWEDTIAAFAKYWLMKQSGRVWSNPDMAAVHYEMYHRGVARARCLGTGGRAHALLAVSMRPFV